MISAPLRPSSTIRVGATRRSPTPAWAPASGAAARQAARMDLVQIFITAIPTWLRNGAIALAMVRNGLFSVNHKPEFAANPPISLIIDSDVERPDIGPARGRRIQRHRAADREVDSWEARVGEYEASGRIGRYGQRLRWIGLVGQHEIRTADANRLLVRSLDVVGGGSDCPGAGKIGVGAVQHPGLRNRNRRIVPHPGPKRDRSETQ